MRKMPIPRLMANGTTEAVDIKLNIEINTEMNMKMNTEKRAKIA